MNNLAVIAITDNGIKLGNELFRKSNGHVDRYTIKKCAGNGWNDDNDSLAELVQDVFAKYSGLIMIMAAGIVVRTLGPLLTSKVTDPAVIVMDEKGNFAISLLSGHLGGANQLVTEIASLLGCQAVITTGTDVNKLTAIDSLAKSWDMDIEPVKNIKIFNKALLQGKQYRFWIEQGYNLSNDILAQHIEDYHHNAAYNVLITHRVIANLAERENLIFLRPKNLVLGIGCRKGISFAKLWSAFGDFFSAANLSTSSVAKIATICLKGQEEALLKLTAKLNCQLITYSKNEIDNCFKKYNCLNTSEFVQSIVDVPGVCEPAALLASGNQQLLVAKTKYEGITFAVAALDQYTIKKSFCWFK